MTIAEKIAEEWWDRMPEEVKHSLARAMEKEIEKAIYRHGVIDGAERGIEEACGALQDDVPECVQWEEEEKAIRSNRWWEKESD